MEGPERLRARALTDFSSRPHHDIGSVYSGVHHSVQPYSTSGLSYVANNSYMQYSNIPTTYSPFSATFPPSSGSSQAALLFSYSGSNSMPYSVQPPPRTVTLPSQHRLLTRNYSSSTVHSQPSTSPVYMRAPFELALLQETEEQDSVNRESGMSEPIEPALEGYPNVDEFDDLMKHYVEQLSPKKQDKALINAQRAANIRFVLSNKKTTSVESAQFRFWAKKMFSLEPSGGSVPVEKKKICHESKPIAVREKLFKILTRAHQKCQHGGRDKTSAQVRKVYSWVPKELISRFVKLCPTCRERRGAVGSGDDENSPSNAKATTSMTTMANIIPRNLSDQVRSSLKRRRSGSINDNGITNDLDIPAQLVNSSSAFQKQNRWLCDFPSRSTYDEPYTPAVPFSVHRSFRALEPSIKLSQEPLTMRQNTSHEPRPLSDHPSQRPHELHYEYE